MSRYVFIYPGIEFETIERDALFAYWDFSEAWSYLGIEPIAVHAEVGGCIPQPQQARQQDDITGASQLHLGAPTSLDTG